MPAKLVTSRMAGLCWFLDTPRRSVKVEDEGVRVLWPSRFVGEDGPGGRILSYVWTTILIFNNICWVCCKFSMWNIEVRIKSPSRDHVFMFPAWLYIICMYSMFTYVKICVCVYIYNFPDKHVLFHSHDLSTSHTINYLKTWYLMAA